MQMVDLLDFYWASLAHELVSAVTIGDYMNGCVPQRAPNQAPDASTTLFAGKEFYVKESFHNQVADELYVCELRPLPEVAGSHVPEEVEDAVEQCQYSMYG